MSYSIIGMDGIDSFDYVLLFKIHLWIPGAGVGYTQIHFDSISESRAGLTLISCPLSEPMGEGMFARFHIERSIIDLISRL